MDKEDGIMEDHSKHPCKQQRMQQKHRIKQTTTAFLTTIIVTFIKLNTGNRNTAVRKQGIRTPQQVQWTQKQGRKRRQQEHGQ
jgi:acyl-CoA hydrolase